MPQSEEVRLDTVLVLARLIERYFEEGSSLAAYKVLRILAEYLEVY